MAKTYRSHLGWRAVLLVLGCMAGGCALTNAFEDGPGAPALDAGVEDDVDVDVAIDVQDDDIVDVNICQDCLHGACVDGQCTAILQLVAGSDFNCVLLASDDVACWGHNDLGQLGVAADDSRWSGPNIVERFVGATSIAAGWSHACVIAADGVLCWGDNSASQLGVPAGTDRESHIPTQVPALGGEPFVALALGFQHGCAINDADQAVCWGSNAVGQLGADWNTTQSAQPLIVDGVADVAQLATGGTTSCARLVGGLVSCWGDNVRDQLGERDGAGVMAKSDSAGVITPLDAAREIALGLNFACSLSEIGDVACWGNNDFGQLGTEAGGSRAKALDIESLTQMQGVRAGLGEHACAFDEGQVRCWGRNDHGQLGNGQNGADQSVSVPVIAQSPWAALRDLALGNRHSCALDDAQQVWCWGANDEGQVAPSLGKGDVLVPVRVRLHFSTNP
ncbi:MAG: hypothetical protein H0U74_12490 [Bradymonadaceae bacterium]|nr:hypothetical protein [Lujinxingiaceae bacterium]